MEDKQSQRPEIAVFLDDAPEPIAIYRPPATLQLDTRSLEDGDHRLRLRAVDSLGNVSNRVVHFSVHNGPGITVTGLRDGSRVAGVLDINLNAFGGDEPFDPVRAESLGPVPVWTWVMVALIGIWASWYGIEYLQTPPAFAHTPTYAANPALASGLSPATQTTVASAAATTSRTGGAKNVAGFDFGALGTQVYALNCASCHGAQGAGTPGAFPPLDGDPVVNAKSAAEHVHIVLNGLAGKRIGGTAYAAQMPAFGSQLSDAQIAAVIDHERTSWSNHAPTVTPDVVTKGR